MTKILVQMYGGPNGINDSFLIDENDLGDAWRDFYLSTAFCRIGLYQTASNNDGYMPRVKSNGWVYAVTANKRAMVFDTNYDTQIRESSSFSIVRDFVRYVLAKYKYSQMGF
jgi:hypothetical protein